MYIYIFTYTLQTNKHAVYKLQVKSEHDDITDASTWVCKCKEVPSEHSRIIKQLHSKRQDLLSRQGMLICAVCFGLLRANQHLYVTLHSRPFLWDFFRMRVTDRRTGRDRISAGALLVTKELWRRRRRCWKEAEGTWAVKRPLHRYGADTHNAPLLHASDWAIKPKNL